MKSAREPDHVRLGTLLIVPVIGVAVCLLVLNGMDRDYQGSLIDALPQALLIGLYMAPAAYAAELGLFLPIHRFLVRRNVNHVGAYAVAGLLVGALTGPIGFALTAAVILGVVEGHFALPIANTLALRGTAIAGACAGAVAALVFRAMWYRSVSS